MLSILILFFSSVQSATLLSEKQCLHYLQQNISPEDAALGAVVASPSKKNPDYFKHWVRDASLIFRTLARLYKKESSETVKKDLVKRAFQFIQFSIQNQKTENPSRSVGEPLFLANGKPFTEPWGRPQNDGPALRALAMLDFYTVIQLNKTRNPLEELLFPADINQSPVWIDLDFIMKEWKQPCFDLWEEIKADHFFTRMVQAHALDQAAPVFRSKGYDLHAKKMEGTSKEIKDSLKEFWNSNDKKIMASIRRVDGIPYKNSQLDTAVILAALETGGKIFAYDDDRILSTLHQLESSFRELYPINKRAFEGIAIGRYPEDTYDGYQSDKSGNPWFLLTLGVGEFYLRLYAHLRKQGNLKITELNEPFFSDLLHKKTTVTRPTIYQRGDIHFNLILEKIRARAISYLSRVKTHYGPNGEMTEQFNRESGFMQGAEHLTWSYAAYLNFIITWNSLPVQRH